jgi:hypothetical protein
LSSSLGHWIEVLKAEGKLLPDKLLALPGMIGLLEPETFDPALPISQDHVHRLAMVMGAKCNHTSNEWLNNYLKELINVTSVSSAS